MSDRRKKRPVIVTSLVALLLCVAFIPNADAQDPTPEPVGLRDDSPPYALHGPYWVGTRDFVINPDAEEPLEVTVWYPALNPDGLEESVTYPVTMKDRNVPADATGEVIGRALKDSPPDLSSGAYPLVVYSTGFAHTRAFGAYLTEHLASYGFVVIAPDHHETFDFNYQDLPEASIQRPQDILSVINFAETLTASGGALEGMIDTETIAVAGHSIGGYTALAAGGARIDFDGFKARCAAARAERDPNVWLCDPLLSHDDEMAEYAGLDAVPEGLWEAWADPRVDAIIPMAGDSYLFDEAGLAAITIPIMVMGGNGDGATPYEWGALPAYQYASSTSKTLVTFDGAGHNIFGAACAAVPWMLRYGMYFLCQDPNWRMSRSHDLINHFATAFLMATLKGDADAAAALEPGNVSFEGILYETTGVTVADIPFYARWLNPTPHFYRS